MYICFQIDADMILITSEGGKIKLLDAYSTGYTVPHMDDSQNVTLISGSHVNGVLRASFVRPLVTGDKADVQVLMQEFEYREGGGGTRVYVIGSTHERGGEARSVVVLHYTRWGGGGG